MNSETFARAGVTKVGDDQPCGDSDTIARGQDALKRLEHATWPDWCAVGNALAAGRTIVMLQVGANAPQGPRYRKRMGEWLRCHGFDRIDKSDRARLLEVADSLIAINAWRDGLPPEQQLRLNSPATVLRAWKRASAPTESGSKDARPPQSSTVAALEDAFRQLSAPDQGAFLEKILAEPNRVRPKILAQLEAQFVRQHQRVQGEGFACEKIAMLARKSTALLHHPEQHRDELCKLNAQIVHLADPSSKARKVTAAKPALDTGALARGLCLPAAGTDDATVTTPAAAEKIAVMEVPDLPEFLRR